MVAAELDLQQYAEYCKQPRLETATEMLERTREPLMESRVAASVAVRDNSTVVISSANPTEAALVHIYPSGWMKAVKLPTQEAQVALLLGNKGVWEKLKRFPNIRAEKLPDTLGGFVGTIGVLFQSEPAVPTHISY